MINTLLIKNFALIKSLEVDFEKGFTVVSGETGSGKSIMLDAISLLMGKRSDRGSLYDKEKKCILEIEIELSNDKQVYFKKNNLDFDNKTIIRREISYSGKSRSFINDTPVSLSVLNDIVSSTIEIYSQNQSISLKSEEKQLELLDNLADSKGLIQNYKVVYNKYNKLKNEIENIKKGNKLSDAELEFLNFQIDELFQSKLKEGEKEELESQFIILENSSNIIEKLSESFQLLSEENGVNTKVSQIENELQKLSDLSERLNDLVERVSSVRIELSDIESEMNILSELVDNNPESLMIVSNRLDHLNSLLVKHRKSTVYELILLLEEMNLKVESSSDFEKIIDKKNKELKLCENELQIHSNVLTKNRKSVASSFKSNVEFHLQKLGIKSPVFNVEITELSSFTSLGKDKIQFLFSANKGNEPLEIHKVASGGELSRLMLCFSYLLSEFNNLSSLIFDEIDTGVSGEIADLMSEMMKSMSEKRQVLSVTHLPQIASKADIHFRVFKSESNDRTTSKIVKLNMEGRIEEIAKMLSGKKITKTSISNAKELLSQ
ncbi:MAG: DNA repair protein RecN [Flavobacteriales bacterium]